MGSLSTEEGRQEARGSGMSGVMIVFALGKRCQLQKRVRLIQSGDRGWTARRVWGSRRERLDRASTHWLDWLDGGDEWRGLR